MTLQCHLGSALPQVSKIRPHLHRYNSVRVHPYAHPQHMKVLNHFIHIQCGCGMQSMVVYSLNHTTTSFGPRLTLLFQNLAPTCTDNSARVHPYAHPLHMKVLKHFVYFQNGCGRQQSVWLTASTMTPQPQHIWAPPYPNFPKFGPHLHMYNSVRVHSYAHPQHMKVLEHFIHIQYGCGMQ